MRKKVLSYGRLNYSLIPILGQTKLYVKYGRQILIVHLLHWKCPKVPWDASVKCQMEDILILNRWPFNIY